MKITQVRNATIIIEYSGKKFLVDPWLGPKDYMPGFDMAINSDIRQPRVELPFEIEKIVDVDAVIVTHVHPDHWDEFAERAIAKNKLFFVQSETDRAYILSKGFKNVEIIEENGTKYENIVLYKTFGQHGRREVVEALCKDAGMPYDEMGVVFEAENEKTLYVAGDTIWCAEVETALKKYSPAVIVVNACGATLLNGESIIMKESDVANVLENAQNAVVIASHMDTVSHLSVTRGDLKKFISENGIKNLLVPEDGESMSF